MRYVVYGAGAIGGAIGARLAAAGADVTLIARGTHLERMRADGLRVRSVDADRVHRIPAVSHPREVDFRGDEVVLLTMKSQDTQPALDALRAAAGPSVPVVGAQNGVENERMAVRRFEHVYAMLVVLPASFLEPGLVIVHAAPPYGVLDCGRFPEGVDALTEAMGADLTRAGFICRPTTDAMRLKYGKLITNLYNAVTAICAPGPETRALTEGVRAEAMACLEAAGIAYAGEEEMRAISALPARGEVAGAPRAGTSTWQSLERGTGNIEADYLNGEITLLGRLHGVPTPLNLAVQAEADRVAREGRAPGSASAATLLRAAGGARRD